tara:strand:+ start:551 stop:1984 length:1434 start_codon:yes stop_codon:yes gene_type:complete
MSGIGSVFLGIMPSNCRNVMHDYASAVKFDKYVIPSCGSFTTAQVLVRAGVDPKKIICSDVSLYSTALGHYLTGKRIDDLGIMIENIPYDITKYESTKDQCAELFLAMRYEQLNKSKSYYDSQIKKELVVNHDIYHKNMAANLQETFDLLHGIEYHIADITEECDKYIDCDKTMIYASPPLVGGVYGKLFNFKNIIWDEPDIPELDFEKFADFYPDYLDRKATVISEVAGVYDPPENWNKISAEYKGNEGVERLLINKEIPKELIKRKKMNIVKPKWKMYNDKNITKHSVVRLTKIKQDEAYYYRDLFIHKLGSTGADITVAFTIDDMLFAVTGLTATFLYGIPSAGKNSDGRLHEKDYIFQIYGLTVPSIKYKRLGRLLAHFITCKEFKDNLEKLEPQLDMVNMNAIRSSAITYAQEQRLVHGLMKRISKERMPNNMFKLVYNTEFHDKTYKECIIKWVDEAKREKELKEKNNDRV